MAELTAVDRKINAQVPGAVVRKDLAKVVKRQCGRPSYVLEYLPGSPLCPTTRRRSRRVMSSRAKNLSRIPVGVGRRYFSQAAHQTMATAEMTQPRMTAVSDAIPSHSCKRFRRLVRGEGEVMAWVRVESRLRVG